MKHLISFISFAFLTLVSVSAQTYRLGDLYDVDGLKGIVVDVDESGVHGLIMSLSAAEKIEWCANKKLLNSTGAFYEDDGLKNMEVIDKFIADGEASSADFPLFAWAKSLGEGWYIASKDETMKIWINMNDGHDTYKIPTSVFEPLNNPINGFDKAQRELGGANIVDTRFKVGTKAPYFWFTSTECDGGLVFTMTHANPMDTKSMLLEGFKPTNFSVFPSKKTRGISYATRAIHKF